ncbi:MAG: FGGY family carbohydrate kinase, partial [Rikenellaceae bacterium]
MYSLGIDIGSSSIKVSLMEISSGRCVASATNPSQEMEIHAAQSGWAEQDPEIWWEYVKMGISQIGGEVDLKQIKSIGISYQMHGLVIVDKEGKPLRRAVIWCDSRAVEIGREALEGIGEAKCAEHLLNSPGNFTASKLKWVKENEPEIFERIDKMMLPGDYIAYKLSGEISTTNTGLSEGILWDFKEDRRADFVADYYGIPSEMIANAGVAIGVQARTSASTAIETGIVEGTPIAYRAGDQPNNAFSLNVMAAGEIAATGGTSGVVYGVIDTPTGDPLSRVNPFLHVNHTHSDPRYGVLLCINGTGIANAWVRRNFASHLSYDEINELAASAPVGSAGVVVLPFGNGAERVLENRYTKCVISGIDLTIHSLAHILRATQEGIAFSFRYGIDIMRDMGLKPNIIRAGKANLFLSPLFRETLSTLCGAQIELYNTDGALGAARGGALGAGLYSSRDEAFSSLEMLEQINPTEADREALESAYQNWRRELERHLQ